MSEALDRIAESNPNIGEQLRDWQIARTQNNEDAYDWGEFRSHTQRLGAPDPGDDEPGEFRQYDWTKYAPSSSYASSSGSSSSGSTASMPDWASNSSNSVGAAPANPSAGQTEEHKSALESLQDFLKHPFGRR